MAYHRSRRLGAWYNSWTDFWGDVSGIAKTTGQASVGLQNTANNAINPTAFRLDATTVLYGGIAVGGLVYLLSRRRNPRGRRR
jgi:hypothetical protein